MNQKFKPGDLVWAKDDSGGELPAEIVSIICLCYSCLTLQYSLIGPAGYGVACEIYLRPRRDDYQQHEGHCSLDDILEVFTKECESVEDA